VRQIFRVDSTILDYCFCY